MAARYRRTVELLTLKPRARNAKTISAPWAANIRQGISIGHSPDGEPTVLMPRSGPKVSEMGSTTCVRLHDLLQMNMDRRALCALIAHSLTDEESGCL